MYDRWTAGGPEGLVLNCHRLAFSQLGGFTLDDPAADTDPTIKEDRARMYRVDCHTCVHLPHAVEEAIAQRVSLGAAADVAVNTRTGEWLPCHRPADDPTRDMLGLVVEHCRDSFVCKIDEPRDGLTVPLGLGDRIDVDVEALAAARMLVGLGGSPWEALEVYCATVGADGGGHVSREA